MGKTFQLPFIFLFYFIIVILLFSGLNLLAFWGGLYSENSEILVKMVVQLIPESILLVLPVSVLTTLVLLLFRILKNPGSRFLSFILPLICALAVMIFGYMGLNLIRHRDEQIPATPARYLVPGKFNSVEDQIVYVGEIEGKNLRSILIIGGSNPEMNFIYYPRGTAETGKEGLSIIIPERPRLVLNASPVYSSIFSQDRFVTGILRDLLCMNRELNTLFMESKTGFYLCCFALIFSFLSASVFMRISKWPLLNVLLGLLVMRGFFSLFRFLREGVALEMEKIVTSNILIQFLPSLILLGFGVLLFLIDILFVPFDMWKREIRGE